MRIYTVRSGDSVFSIARRFNVSTQTIIADNNITNPNRLIVGQALIISQNETLHTVGPGESLFSIARRYGTTVESIRSANPDVTRPEGLQIGQRLVIPLVTPKLGNIDVNGYAFPNISMNVLEDTLPHLTYLSIFSYEVRPDGSLASINDMPLIQAAYQRSVAPLMVITNIEEGGSFSSELASTILNSEALQNTVLDNVVETLNSKNYFGLDIDFEYIYPQDRTAYNRFVQRTVERVRPLGYTITTALAPKLSGEQQGLLYEAHDYAFHGQMVDHIILMTYEWGYTYGPAQAVSPIDQVERVLQYAVSVIPPEKILMGMPNYGYDWTLPFVEGSAARTLTLNGAIELAQRVNARIEYDEKVQAPFFTYYDSSRRQHIVWFDDPRSIDARLRLVDKYNLGGVSYWTINSFYRQNWIILESLYNVNKVI